MKRMQIIVVVLLVLVPLILLIVEKQKFPIKLVVCDSTYKDCFTVAKYNDMSGCQSTSEMWGWLCDSATDPENITCTRGESSISTSYCSN